MNVSAGERQRAEVILEARRSGSPEEYEALEWPSVANRIREARLRVGLKDTEVASRLGITIHSHYDLEAYDFEAFTVISLKELTEFGRILGAQYRELLLGHDGAGLQQSVSFDQVAAALVNEIAKSGLTADQLGDLAGWDITPVLRDPQSLWDYNVEGLYDMGRGIA